MIFTCHTFFRIAFSRSCSSISGLVFLLLGSSLSNMPGDFRYSALKNAESDLRLLQIASGRQHDDLKCTITVHSKHSLRRTKYNALSYTWGDVAVKVPISLNGNIFFVTPNLEGALRNLRCLTPAERGKQLPLWVDAICINQNDIEERDDQ